MKFYLLCAWIAMHSLTGMVVAGIPPYSIEELTSTSGLFYQNLGPAYVYNNYLVLCAYKNLTYYEEKLSQLVSIFERSKNICNTTNHPSANLWGYCSNSLNIAKSQIPMLREKFSWILHLSGQEVARPRRGVLNAVGSGFKWLFGTPDAYDAEQYSRNIEYLLSRIEDPRFLMQQQVRMLAATIDSYNRSMGETKRNIDILNDNIKVLQYAGEGVTKSVHSLTVTTMAIEHVTLLTQLLAHLQQEFDDITNALLFARQNILHPSVINPTDLRQELLRTKLNADLRFPIPLESSGIIQLYFDMVKISVALKNNILVYYLRVPTPFAEPYTLYHMIPLPNANRAKIFSFIVPKHPYLLINPSKTQFSLLDTLVRCKKVQDHHICKAHTRPKPFADITCEVQLQAVYLKRLPADCKTRTIVGNMAIWQEINLNEWLYSLSSQTWATLSCDSPKMTELIAINGTGILRLRAGCQLRVGETILQAYVAPTCNYTHFVPIVDIRTDLGTAEIERTLTRLDVQNITWTATNLEELPHTKYAFDEVEETLISRPYFDSQRDRLLNAAAFTAIVVIIIVLLCYPRCKNRGRQQGSQ